MKKQKTRTRLVSVLLSLCMVLALLPALTLTAFALTDIDRIDITVTAPAAGAAPSAAAETASTEVTIGTAAWYHVSGTESTLMTAGETFVSGDNYEVRVQATPKDGYRLVSPIILTINGESADGKYDDSGIFFLSCTLTASDGTGHAAITSVDITGVTAPVAGNAPVTTVGTSTANVTPGAAVWSVREGGISAWRAMTSGENFADGNRYGISVPVTAAEGYAISSSPVTTVNGNPADWNGGEVHYTWTLGTAITSVDITGVTAPVAGNAPVTTGIGTSTQHVTLGNAYWESSADDGDTWNKMAAGAKFAAGNLYRIIVPVTPASGYVLASPIVVTVNGHNGYLSDDGALYDWDLSSTEISSVAITGVTAPAAGNSPVITGITTSTPNVTLDSASWFVSEGGMFWGQMTAGETFEAGKLYQIFVPVTAAAGYTFAASATATVNGSTATFTGSDVIYTFTGSGGGSEISSVAIAGVTAPAAGKVPVVTGITTTTANVTPGSAFWRVSEDGGKTWKRMAAGETFAADKLYQIVVPVTAAAGCTFAASPAATVNGSAAQWKALPGGHTFVEYTFTDGRYFVTVDNGTGGGLYKPGDTVSIAAADPYAASPAFLSWATASAGVTFANAKACATTFVMPDHAVSVTSNWAAAYDLALTRCTAAIEGTPVTIAPLGAVVTLTANTAPAGTVFAGWAGSSVSAAALADQNAALTTFTMAENAENQVTNTFAAKYTITAVSLTGLAPVAGKTIVSGKAGAAVPSGALYGLSTGGGILGDYIEWETSTDGSSWTKCTAGSVFEAGKYYRLRLMAATNDGSAYLFAAAPGLTVTLDGRKPDTVAPRSDNQFLDIQHNFGKLENYSIIAGAGQSYQKGGSGASFTSDAPFDDYLETLIDSATVPAGDLAVKSGSTKVTISDAYLAALADGAHTLTIVSKGGAAGTTFTLTAASGSTTAVVTSTTTAASTAAKSASPKTGDNSNPAPWVALLALGGAGALSLAVYARKRKNSVQ